MLLNQDNISLQSKGWVDFPADFEAQEFFNYGINTFCVLPLPGLSGPRLHTTWSWDGARNNSFSPHHIFYEKNTMRFTLPLNYLNFIVGPQVQRYELRILRSWHINIILCVLFIYSYVFLYFHCYYFLPPPLKVKILMCLICIFFCVWGGDLQHVYLVHVFFIHVDNVML